MAFSQADVAEVSKERHELLAKVLKAQIMDCETFRSLVEEVYRQAHGSQAAEVVVLADGAHWIWNLVTDLIPHAVQILDFSHAKHYLWDAAKLIYGADSAFICPWVKEREDLLLANKVEQVITHLQHFVDLAPGLESILHYFQQNHARMQYGTYQQRGSFIGSGAIESVGKHLTAARIKGPGMRWNVADLNALLTLRGVFLEHSWAAYWDAQARCAA
ncbi:MAG: hypothetical protein AB7G75_36945 [Candidatus Binatia bacterium]